MIYKKQKSILLVTGAILHDIGKIDAKQLAGTNDSFIYNKHVGNVYLK